MNLARPGQLTTAMCTNVQKHLNVLSASLPSPNPRLNQKWTRHLTMTTQRLAGCFKTAAKSPSGQAQDALNGDNAYAVTAVGYLTEVMLALDGIGIRVDPTTGRPTLTAT
jgi:hypothetical protein